MEQLRKEYRLEDKELIEEAKNLKSESPAQKVQEKGQLPDKIGIYNKFTPFSSLFCIMQCFIIIIIMQMCGGYLV